MIVVVLPGKKSNSLPLKQMNVGIALKAVSVSVKDITGLNMDRSCHMTNETPPISVSQLVSNICLKLVFLFIGKEADKVQTCDNEKTVVCRN